jgi:Uma2 family endonuclease
MVNTATIDILRSLGEKRISLSVDWLGYQTIYQTLNKNRSVHLTYYQGILEIVSPLEEHENVSGLIGQFIVILTEEFNLNLKTMGSTTLRRSSLPIGAEPDQSYYILNEPLVRGKFVNFETDPLPDLVVEVDITHTDIDKNALYAELGIPEFWRYNGKICKIYQLQAGQYQEVATSATFPNVTKERLYEFLLDCQQQGETIAKQKLRTWIRQQLG